ncbi:fasciclin domain-containing protein [Chitinophaga sp. MM2321]|uniref:fasciclin domain-containing protein n=1 Tax=Chitinophaga sp. MM2321 TaxID=3137178 RepID=UPI0032D5A59E
MHSSGKPGRILLLLLLALAVWLTACKKDYYNDTGLQKGVFPGSSYEFLQSQPYFFDTVATVIQLAGLENVLRDSTITFFAPTDYSVQMAMAIVNSDRHANFKDSLQLADIPSEVWRKYLSRYIFRDKFMLKDIPRFMSSQPEVYPGMNMESWQGYIMNLGVLFSDYNGTRDVGPRQVMIADMGSLDNPVYNISLVATSDLQTKNGVIHVLDANHQLGFNPFDFAATVREYLQ